jgi:hypothetical protein
MNNYITYLTPIILLPIILNTLITNFIMLLIQINYFIVIPGLIVILIGLPFLSNHFKQHNYLLLSRIINMFIIMILFSFVLSLYYTYFTKDFYSIGSMYISSALILSLLFGYVAIFFSFISGLYWYLIAISLWSIFYFYDDIKSYLKIQ